MRKIFKTILFSIFLCASILTVSSCKNDECGKYEIKEVNFYKKKDEVDRKIKLRFYEATPTVPYIGVKEFYKEFYNTDLEVTQDNSDFKYTRGNAYIEIDTKSDIFTINNIDLLASHPDFKESNSKVFYKPIEEENTTLVPKTISLKTYSIESYKSTGDAYLPLTLISNIVTGCNLFLIVYNEENLYEFDYQGQLSNNMERTETYYGDSFKEPMMKDTDRSKDMIDFSYNLMCLLIDNFRGYTTQMEFIDNNIVTLGLNGTLEKYYPEIKTYLLSKNRKEYMAGVSGLFMCLADGGHTALMTSLQKDLFDGGNLIPYYENYQNTVQKFTNSTMKTVLKLYSKASMSSLKKEAFGITSHDNYYYSNAEKKVAYLGFDHFEVNYDGWDSYYKAIEKGDAGVIPREKDTYSYVRSKLYQALDDGMEYLVLDLSTNGGGNSGALLGVLGLLNESNATMAFNDVVNHFRTDSICKVDINLDGKFDDKDVTEARKFKDLNVVILTSNYAFSCGNLLPSLLKGLGFKTIGEKTGGGSCAIMLGAMPDGAYYIRSSYKCLSDEEGNNIDSGVLVDVSLLKDSIAQNGITINDYSNFYNIDYVHNVLTNLFS